MSKGDSLYIACGEFDDKIDVIGLDLGIRSGTIASDLAAFVAFVDDHISFFGIGFHSNGAQDPAAGIGTVPWVDVNMKGAEATGTVIAGAVSQGSHFKAAIFADEAIVIFCKAFLFHGESFFGDLFFKFRKKK